MQSAKVIISPEDPKRSLRMIAVGRCSALEVVISGLPSNVSNVQFHLQDELSSPYSTYAAEALAFGDWSVVVPGAAFGTVGDVLYHVTALDDQGFGKWFGAGKCRIMPSVMQVCVGEEDPEGAGEKDLFARNRKTGLYHKIEIDQDDNGNPFPVIQKEGVSR